MKSSYLILLISLSAGIAQASEPGAACGLVSTNFRPPEPQDLFNARVDAVNGKGMVKRAEFPLSPGTYELKVYEHITTPDLMVSAKDRGYSKKLSVTVEDGKRYDIGAKYIRDKKTSRKDFWEPVVWRVEARKGPCKPLNVPAS